MVGKLYLGRHQMLGVIKDVAELLHVVLSKLEATFVVKRMKPAHANAFPRLRLDRISIGVNSNLDSTTLTKD